MHSKSDSFKNWPIPVENHFSDKCINPTNGEAKVRVDTNGSVFQVINYKCGPGDSNYFYTNLLKMKFQPCVFSGKPIPFMVILKLRYCNLTKNENKKNDGEKPVINIYNEDKKENPIKNVRVVKKNKN
jgi:ribosomal protein L24E